MTAVVTLRPGQIRTTLSDFQPTQDYEAVRMAQESVIAEILHEWERNGKEGLCAWCRMSRRQLEAVQERGVHFSVQRYGMFQWGDLFTARQKVALVRLGKSTREAAMEITNKASLQNLLAIALDRSADYWSALCSWHLTGEKVNHTYGRQVLPMIWDFTEVNPWSSASGNYDGAIAWCAKTVEVLQGRAYCNRPSRDVQRH